MKLLNLFVGGVGAATEWFTEEELYLLCKSDATEGRLAEMRMYELAGVNRLQKEAGVYVGDSSYVTGVWTGCGFVNGGFSPTLFSPELLSAIAAIGLVVKYYDAEDELQTLASSLYQLAIVMGRVVIVYKDGLPAVYDRPDAVSVTCNVGFLLANLPAVLKQSVGSHVVYWFDSPEESMKRYSSTFDYVVDMYRGSWV